MNKHKNLKLSLSLLASVLLRVSYAVESPLPFVQIGDSSLANKIFINALPTTLSTTFSIRGNITGKGFAAFDVNYKAGLVYVEYTPFSAAYGTVTVQEEELAFREKLGNVGNFFCCCEYTHVTKVYVRNLFLFRNL